MYLTSIHYFRGLAILFVVFGHCYAVGGWGIDSFPEKMLANTITGGTHLFVFISGLLFHHIFLKNYRYLSFLKKKIEKIFIPYLVLSLIGLLRAFIFDDLPFGDLILSGETGLVAEYIKPIFVYLWTGRIYVGYWYIPFILLTFLISPLYIVILKVKQRWQVVIFIISLFVSIFMHRPMHHMVVWQSVVYFFPIFLLGMICSVHKRWLYQTLEGKSLYLLFGAFTMGVLQILIYDKFGNFHKPPFSFGGIDMMILQKIFLCLFLMIFFHRFEKMEVPFLNSLADHSFPIFFLHPFVICAISCTNKYLHVEPTGFLTWIITSLTVLIASFLISRISRGLYQLIKIRWNGRVTQPSTHLVHHG